MTKDELIKKIVNENLSLCQNNTEVNDGVIFDLLVYGFKGLNNMSMEELKQEWDVFKRTLKCSKCGFDHSIQMEGLESFFG